MADQKAVPIDLAAIPYRFDIELAAEIFTFEVHYNALFDFFTVDLLKNNVPLVYGEKMVYGAALFSALTDKRLPKVAITPLDVSGIETAVNYSNLCKTVFLFISEASA